jgi:hypothetical protein
MSEAEVERLIRADLSPEQAADRLALEGRLQISLSNPDKSFHESLGRVIQALWVDIYRGIIHRPSRLLDD